MKRLIGITLICAMMMSAITACSPVVLEMPTESVETTQEGPARPQDDYYKYINGEVLKNATFNYGDSSAAKPFDPKIIDDQIDGIIKDTVKGSGYEKGSEEYVLKTAYDAFINYDFNNEPIPQDLLDILDEIDNAKTIDELIQIDAKLVKDYATTPMIGLSVTTNTFSSNENILIFNQITGVLSVSFTDVRDDNFALDDVVNYGKLLMQSRGFDADTSEEYGRKLASVALELYGATNIEEIDSLWQEQYMSLKSSDEINNILTNIDLTAYLSSVGFAPEACGRFIVCDQKQLECLNSLLTEDNLDAFKTLETSVLIEKYIRFFAPHNSLLKSFVKDSYDPIEEQAVNELQQIFAKETDPLFVEKYYSKEMDYALVSMCDDIREGYRGLISNATWLTEGTRKELLEKLDNIIYVTGMDLKRHDNSKFAGIGGNYYEIMLQYERIFITEKIESLTKPSDRKEIFMAMQTINACYDPGMNNITITVAITYAPFFDVNADYYTNLGGLGSVIAHEMGHAFDSNCIVFDKNGNYNPDWIAPEDMEKLNERNQQAISYFEDNFTVFGVYHVDGARTLGENYADLGGLECITSLAKNDEDLRKLFENYAVCWRVKRVDTAVLYLIAYDEHSPEVIRVNAMLSTLDCFYEAYDVKEGDGMYIAPEKRISRWY